MLSEPVGLLLGDTGTGDEAILELVLGLVELEGNSSTLELPVESVLATDAVAIPVPLEAVELSTDVDVVASCSEMLLLLAVVLGRLWL